MGSASQPVSTDAKRPFFSRVHTSQSSAAQPRQPRTRPESFPMQTHDSSVGPAALSAAHFSHRLRYEMQKLGRPKGLIYSFLVKTSRRHRAPITQASCRSLPILPPVPGSLPPRRPCAPKRSPVDSGHHFHSVIQFSGIFIVSFCLRFMTKPPPTAPGHFLLSPTEGVIHFPPICFYHFYSR